MQKKLSELLAHIDADTRDLTQKQKDTVITGLAFDSRAVQKGFLFFALPGVHVHGNAFIKSALKNGAAAVLYQDELPTDVSPNECGESTHGGDTVFIRVKDTRFTMAGVSDAFYDLPSSRLTVFGVTGTEGKSTTVFLLWQLLRLCGKKCGFISTVDYSLGGEAIANSEHQTTPEAPIINERLWHMVQNGCTHAVIESSSHGLSARTNRLGSVLFDAAAFMNVTSEHLEFHGTIDQYRNDKANLFRALDAHEHVKGGVPITVSAAVNLDDKAAHFFAESTAHAVCGFTVRGAPHETHANGVCSAAPQETNAHQDSVTAPTETLSAAETRTTETFAVPPNVECVFCARNIESDSKGTSFIIEENVRKNATGARTDESACTNAVTRTGKALNGATTEKTADATSMGAAHGYTAADTQTNTALFERTTVFLARLNIPGTFNVYNALAALILVSKTLGIPAQTVAAHFPLLTPVKGRMFPVNMGQPFEVIVDYAHTPSSFMTIFPPLKERAKGKIIAVFGSGGERDTQKRPEQGKIAARYCDIVILADEDPRGEEPMALLEDIAKGCTDLVRGESLFLIPCRADAIQKAFTLAQKGDIVLLLGKGHENSIIYKDYTMPYDEITQAKTTLRTLGYTQERGSAQ